MDSPDAGDLEDVPAALSAQVGQRRLRHPQGPKQVRLHLSASLLLAEFFESAELSIAGVVDNDIQATEVVVGLLHHAFHRCLVGDIQRQGQNAVPVDVVEGVQALHLACGRHDLVPAPERCLPPRPVRSLSRCR